MLKHIRLAACIVVLSLGTRALADPAPNSVPCFASDPATLAKTLSQSLTTRPLLPVQKTIPAGEDGAVTIAGVGSPETQKEWHFRVFVAPSVFGVHSVGAANLWELHPTTIEQGAPGTPKDAYTLHFVSPPDGDSNLLHWRKTRTVIVVACDGDSVGAWAARPVVFAPPRPAKLWAGLFIAAIYFIAAIVVYKRRLRASKRKDDSGEVYRIAEVRKWPFERCLNPVAMTADNLDRGSLPKFQILFFVGLVTWGLTYLVIYTGALSDLSPSLVYLLGLPAFGTLGSLLANTNSDRMSLENWAWLVTRRVLPLNDPGRAGGPRWSDLIMNETELDLSKLQALTFSCIVGFSMLTTGPEGFGKFEVPATLLQILGLSQVVLVGGKLVKPTTMRNLDDLITELRNREVALRKAANTGVDVDETGKPLTPAPNRRAKRALADVDAAAKVVPMAVERYRETAGQVQVVLETISRRAVDTANLRNFKLS